MSIHSSLRTGSGKKFRSVLKRHERLKVLKDKNLWNEERSVLGIPKVKQQRIKVKKEKAAAAGTAEATAAPATGATPAAAAAAPTKGTPAKGAPAKEAGKAEKK